MKSKKKLISDDKVNEQTKLWNISSKVEIIRELSEEQNEFEENMETDLNKLLKNEELDDHVSMDKNLNK